MNYGTLKYMVSPDVALELLQTYGYLMLFCVAFLEGPIITVLASFLAAQGVFDLGIVFAVILSANLGGDLFYYYIGYFGKTHLIEKWGHMIGVTSSHIQSLEQQFRKNDTRAIIIGKITHSAGFLVLMAAGAAHMKLTRFMAINTVAEIPKSLIFLFIGYFAGSAYNSVNSYIEQFTIILAAIIATAATYKYFRYRSRKTQQP